MNALCAKAPFPDDFLDNTVNTSSFFTVRSRAGSVYELSVIDNEKLVVFSIMQAKQNQQEHTLSGSRGCIPHQPGVGGKTVLLSSSSSRRILSTACVNNNNNNNKEQEPSR